MHYKETLGDTSLGNASYVRAGRVGSACRLDIDAMNDGTVYHR
jgi:hypothetical protein